MFHYVPYHLAIVHIHVGFDTVIFACSMRMHSVIMLSFPSMHKYGRVHNAPLRKSDGILQCVAYICLMLCSSLIRLA